MHICFLPAFLHLFYVDDLYSKFRFNLILTTIILCVTVLSKYMEYRMVIKIRNFITFEFNYFLHLPITNPV